MGASGFCGIASFVTQIRLRVSVWVSVSSFELVVYLSPAICLVTSLSGTCELVGFNTIGLQHRGVK